MKLNDKRVVVGGLAVIGVLVIMVVAYNLVPKVMVTLTKAAPATKVSVYDSYVIGSNLLARADGEDTAIINVFLLDKNGKPVAGKIADLTGANNIVSQNQLSDNDGKIVFEVRSTEERQYELSGVYEGMPIGSPVTVTFRNVK